MKFLMIAAGVLPMALASTASAQTVEEDMRCVLLSGMFMKEAKDEKGKEIARVTGAFFLGRIDGRFDAKAVAAARKSIDPKTAGAAMNACAVRLSKAQKSVNALGRPETPAP